MRISNTWYDTDPTWDDIDTGAQWRNMYYMKNANTLKLHTVDTDWMQEDAITAHGGHTQLNVWGEHTVGNVE